MTRFVVGLCQMKNGILDAPYIGTNIEAESNMEVKRKAKEWVASESVRENSWLQILKDGKAVASLKPGEY